VIDWTSVERATLEALIAVGNRWGATAVGIARSKAPVRKVFEGQSAHERVRLKTMDEIEKDRGIRKSLGLGPEYGPLNPQRVNPATVLTRNAPQELGQRRIASPGRLRITAAEDRLDRRGRWELSSMRAAHRGRLGGRLRSEIFSTQARVYGHKVVLELVSPTPYAKYQEFGTRHHPAHPYLRPGAYESTESVRADLRATMPRVVAGQLRATIPVVIRI
jgi:HK97 gp10 family phage protein